MIVELPGARRVVVHFERAAFWHEDGVCVQSFGAPLVLVEPLRLGVVCRIHPAFKSCEFVGPLPASIHLLPMNAAPATTQQRRPCSVKAEATGRSVCKPPDVFKPDVGRKLALAHAIRGWSKPDRAAVWARYLRRQAPKPSAKKLLRACLAVYRDASVLPGEQNFRVRDILLAGGRLP